MRKLLRRQALQLTTLLLSISLLNGLLTKCSTSCKRIHSSKATHLFARRQESSSTMKLPRLVKTRRWDDMIERLVDFYQKNGHSLVTKQDDVELYQWTQTVRRNYRHQALNHTPTSRRPRLSQEKMTLLQSIQFPWNVQNAVWQRRYQQLQQFHARHGHCRVPPTCREFAGLGVWIRNQRREYRRLQLGQHSTLTQERLRLLVKLDFEWYRSHQVAWEMRYRELQAFHQQFGHSNVPEDYVDNFSLGQWCMNQRTAYRRYANGEPTALTLDRIQALEQVDFCWNFREHQWYSMQERLKQYYQQHGHVSIATSDKDNSDLRLWLILQRYHYNRRKQQGLKSPLTRTRIEALERAIPNFSWKGRDSAGPSTKDWAKLFDAMREKGIQPGMRPKQHWFEGMNPFEIQIKDTWTEQDLWELWHQGDDDDDDDSDEEVDVSGYSFIKK